MQMFKASTGHVFIFGYDMFQRKENVELICWSDASGEFPLELSASSDAGWQRLTVDVIDPQFICETRDCIVAFQPGLCIEISYVGAPFIWAFKTLRKAPDNIRNLKAA